MGTEVGMNNEQINNEKYENQINSQKLQNKPEEEKNSEGSINKNEEIKRIESINKNEEIKKNESINKNEEIKSYIPEDKKEEQIKINESIDKKEEIISPISQNILVKIKIDDGYWEKEYNKETLLNKIESDFKEVNIIKRNHYIEFSYNKIPIQMDSRQLNTIIKEGQNEIIFEKEIKQIPGTKKKEIIEPVDYIGKPLYNPFEIYIFEIRKKIISKIKYSKEKERIFELNKIGIDSAYCNGTNHLFISGGIDPSSGEILNLFLDFDLINKKFNENIINMPIPKKNHRMIYINNKVYIIGGNDETTMIYDINDNNIREWVKLNKKKFEPSLIKYNNYLFCIDSSQKYLNNYNFEKIDIYEENPEWEEVKPKISPDILNLNFSQKFFGIVEDKYENLIFIGGIYDNNMENNYNNNKEYFNLQYNVEENLIEKSNIYLKNNNLKEINLNEKSFSPIDNNKYIIFPDFIRRSPKILYYYKDKNTLEINAYHSNPRLTKIANQNRIISLEESLKEIDFNMPNLNNKKININENIKTKFEEFNIEQNAIAPEYKKYIKLHQENNNKYNDKYNDKYIINTKNKNIIERSINININCSKDNNKKFININNNYHKENNNIYEPKVEKKIDNIYKQKFINIDNNQNFDSNIQKNITDENKISNISIEKEEIKDIKKENEIKEEINEENEKISKEKEEIKEEDNTKDKKLEENEIKQENDKKPEKNENSEQKSKKSEVNDKQQKMSEVNEIKSKKSDVNDEKSKKSGVNDNKIDESEKGGNDNNLPKINIDNNKSTVNEQGKSETNKIKTITTTNIEIFDYDKAYSYNTFHSSVNRIEKFEKLDNNKVVNKRFNKKYLNPPKDINLKIIKKERRKFNNFEINEFIDNSNY